MKDVKCPYCDADQEICHDDDYGYKEGVLHQQDCSVCEKTFTYNTEISFYYEAHKADCLNGGEHIWKETNTIPKCFRRLKCKNCDEEKEIEGIGAERKEYFQGLKEMLKGD